MKNLLFQILLYYDITLKQLTCEKFDPEKSSINFDEVQNKISSLKQKTRREVIESLLYDV